MLYLLIIAYLVIAGAFYGIGRMTLDPDAYDKPYNAFAILSAVFWPISISVFCAYALYDLLNQAR
jgi:hypothetical protein